MIKIEELQKMYDKMSIAEIEVSAGGHQSCMRESQVEMVKVLYYLENTKRYKENRRYAKASFGEYVDGVFSIREGTYREWKRAVLHWEKEVLKHGVGLPAKVASICGALKAPKVFAGIDQIIAGAKKDGPAVRDKIETLIRQNAARQRITKPVMDYKAMYEREAAAHNITKNALDVAMGRLNDLESQIVKLKMTADRIKNIRKIIEGPPFMDVRPLMQTPPQA